MAPNAQDSFTTDADDVEVVLNANAQDSEMQTTCVRWLGDEKQEQEDEQEDPHATHHGKFGDYDLVVDPDQGDSANEIKLCSIKRPHMRAFHCSWWSYHVAFLMWFAISPLQHEIQTTLDLTTEQLWTATICSVTGTIFMRFLLGPFVDKFGPRIPMGIILFLSAIPTALTGLVNTATGLAVLRFFIGIGGSTFVMCQFWTSIMFTKKWVGTANATVAGWGNLGGGISNILMGSILFPFFKNVVYDGNSEKAWRTVCVFPAALGFITSFLVIKFADDSPRGNFSKLKRTDERDDVDVLHAFKKGIVNTNTWLLFVQYACCFGVEITMNNAASLYFIDKFALSTEKAATIASVFGFMNLFARAMGGYFSDKANDRFGMRGRLGIHSFVLFMEGSMVVGFAFCSNLGLAITVLVFFSIFVQAAEGTSFAIVPYINPTYTGALSGIIGSGGNVGGVVFSLCFQQMDFKHAYLTMGCLIMLSSLLSVFVFIKGQSGLVWRTSIVAEESCKSTLADGSVSKQEGKSPVLSKESEETASDASV